MGVQVAKMQGVSVWANIWTMIIIPVLKEKSGFTVLSPSCGDAVGANETSTGI